MKDKFKSYLISGIFMLYFAMKGDFVLLYNGIALMLSVAAFYKAFVAYKNKKT